jgi:predicted amidohydrolase
MKHATALLLALLLGLPTATTATAATTAASAAPATKPAAWSTDFSQEKNAALPAGWKKNFPDIPAATKANAPRFALSTDTEGRHLLLSGGGDPLVGASVFTKIKLPPGTYTYSAVFSKTDDVNPHRHLLFQIEGGSKDGIFKYYKLENGQIEGRDTVVIKASGNGANATAPRDVTLRVHFRHTAAGEVKLRSLALTPAAPVKPQWVRFATLHGRPTFEQLPALAAAAANDGADLLLYPEDLTQKNRDASGSDAILDALSTLAAKHKMYLGASVLVVDKTDGHKYNRGVLFDRAGKLLGSYDKIHPYSPETSEGGVSPGSKTDVFQTEFGKVGMIICYDSWFTDVTQLLALKGAKVILFPVAGYYRSLLHARAADNGVRFVASTLGNGGHAIFDTAGRDIEAPGKDRSVGAGSGKTFKNLKITKVGNISMLSASLDLNASPSPHYNGGKMSEAPGGKRSRADQVLYLEDLIKKEKERWWEE